MFIVCNLPVFVCYLLCVVYIRVCVCVFLVFVCLFLCVCDCMDTHLTVGTSKQRLGLILLFCQHYGDQKQIINYFVGT